MSEISQSLQKFKYTTTVATTTTTNNNIHKCFIALFILVTKSQSALQKNI